MATTNETTAEKRAAHTSPAVNTFVQLFSQAQCQE